MVHRVLLLRLLLLLLDFRLLFIIVILYFLLYYLFIVINYSNVGLLSLLLQPAYAPPLFTSSSLFVVGRAGRQRSALETKYAFARPRVDRVRASRPYF